MKVLHVFVLAIEATVAYVMIGWMVFARILPDKPEVLDDATELRFSFADGQKALLDKIDSYTVFYATEENQRQWTDPALRFGGKIDAANSAETYKHSVAKGLTRLRLEFNPKKNITFCRQWPELASFSLGERRIRESEIKQYFYEPAEKPSYDVQLVDITKGGALWIVIAILGVLEIATIVVVIKLINSERRCVNP